MIPLIPLHGLSAAKLKSETAKALSAATVPATAFSAAAITPQGVTVNNITISGVNGAKITKTGDSYLVSAAGKNVVYENITFTDTVRIDSNPSNLTFKNCRFEAGFRMPHSAADGNVTIENCTFTGNESGGYAVFAQGIWRALNRRQ